MIFKYLNLINMEAKKKFAEDLAHPPSSSSDEEYLTEEHVSTHSLLTVDIGGQQVHNH